jgi:hypothetical protein
MKNQHWKNPDLVKEFLANKHSLTFANMKAVYKIIEDKKDFQSKIIREKEQEEENLK